MLIQGSASGYQRVTSGVPQGSVLGPALFLIYINDISVGLSSHIRLFVDDALMHLNCDSPTASATFQRDLNQLKDWPRLWNMSSNTNKCFIVIFGNSGGNGAASENFVLGGTVLREIDYFKYLGVLVSNKFDWSEHISKNKSEAMRTLGLLRRALSVAPEKVKYLAYKTLCRPKLEYAVEV